MVNFTAVPVEQIQLSDYNPRRINDKDQRIKELAKSIAEVGMRQPITVRKVGDKYEVVAGECRYRAVRLLKRDTIEAVVEEYTDAEARVVMVTENMQRSNLTPLEEARGIDTLCQEADLTLEQVAAKLGKSLGFVARRRQLVKLTKNWQKWVDDPECCVHAWPLTYLEDVAALAPAAQDQLAHELQYAVEHHELPNRQLWQRHIGDLTHLLEVAPWDLTDATLYPKAGACLACPVRASCNKGLFTEVGDMAEDGKLPKGDRCLDTTCWNEKLAAHRDRLLSQLAKDHGEVLLSTKADYREREALPEPLKKRLVGDWQIVKTRKGAEGAKPVLDPVTCGLTWGKVRIERADSMGATTRGRPVGPDGKVKPMTMAQRRAQLRKRREAFIVKKVQAEVMKPLKRMFPAAQIYALVAAFGTRHYQGDHTDSDRAWGVYKKAMTSAGAKAALPALWEEVRQVLHDRLDFYKEPPISNARAVADLIGLDWKALEGEAAEELPEPKVWALLKADGTRKGEKRKVPEKQEPSPAEILDGDASEEE